MDFKVTPTQEPIDVAQIAALKEQISDLARRIPDAKETEIVNVPGGQRIVKTSDRYLVVDPRGGPVKIVLPIPAVKQELTVKNSYMSGNAVTIVRTDGKTFGDGTGSVTVPSGPAANLLCDGSQWWVL